MITVITLLHLGILMMNGFVIRKEKKNKRGYNLTGKKTTKKKSSLIKKKHIFKVQCVKI